MNPKCYPVFITSVSKHPKADRLELAHVLGFTSVITSGSFQSGDKAWFIETDAVLPPQLELKILGGSKMRLNGGRVRATKIRGVVSEGILLPIGALTETDVSMVSKYEPPERGLIGVPKIKSKVPADYTTALPKYIDTIRLEKVPDIFLDDDTVHVTAKLHGTSVRYGWADLVPNSHWAAVKLWFRRILGYSTREFICGTRNMELNTPKLYHEVAERLELAKRIPYGTVLYGEIIGPGIQKNYTYGLKQPELRLYAVQQEGRWLDYWEFLSFAHAAQLPVVPLIAQGNWGMIKEKLMDFVDKNLYPTSEEMRGCPCREGLVIGTMQEHPDPRTGSRTIVKYLNPQYLLDRHNSDEH